MRALVALSIALAALACSKAEDPAPAKTDSGASADSTAADTDGALHDSVVVTDSVASDSEEADSEAPIDSGTDSAPPEPVDCFTDDFGPSSTTLTDFFYQVQVGECQSSKCSNFVKFDPSCVLILQVDDVEHAATLSPEACAHLTKWLTSDLLVSHLRDSTTCAGLVSGVFEMTQLNLGDGPASKKTFMCTAEPFASHRACINKLRAVYFPGI